MENGKNSDDGMKKLNPQIAMLEYGVRELKEVTIYPLSIPDQMKLTDIIQEAIGALAGTDGTDAEFIKVLVQRIRESLVEVLKLATGMKKPEITAMLDDMTSMQAWTIAERIFQMNLGDVLKNAKGLIAGILDLLPSMRPLPLSANVTPDTELSTSPDSISEMEV